VNQTFVLSYLDPYFTIDGISQGFDLYKRNTDTSSLASGAYVTDAIGGGVKYGIPLSEVTTVSFGLSAEAVDLQTFANSPQQYIDFVNTFGNSYSYGTATAGLANDTRDSLIQTNAGSLMRVSSELAGGDLRFYRLGFEYRWYRPMTRTLTLLLGGDIGYASGRDGMPLPFFKNFYGGGPGSVRGYEAFSLGPQDAAGNTTGGDRKLNVNAELLFPMPGAAQDRSLRLAWFLDGGQVFNHSYELDTLRYSTGLAFNWASPFGPLKLSYARPLNEKSTDRIQRLQFTLGYTF
jgi:outer membrane protein insertion porin family